MNSVGRKSWHGLSWNWWYSWEVLRTLEVHVYKICECASHGRHCECWNVKKPNFYVHVYIPSLASQLDAHKWREGYLLPTWARKICLIFWLNAPFRNIYSNVGKLFCKLKLVTDNLLFMHTYICWTLLLVEICDEGSLYDYVRNLDNPLTKELQQQWAMEIAKGTFMILMFTYITISCRNDFLEYFNWFWIS